MAKTAPTHDSAHQHAILIEVVTPRIAPQLEEKTSGHQHPSAETPAAEPAPPDDSVETSGHQHPTAETTAAAAAPPDHQHPTAETIRSAAAPPERPTADSVDPSNVQVIRVESTDIEAIIRQERANARNGMHILSSISILVTIMSVVLGFYSSYKDGSHIVRDLALTVVTMIFFTGILMLWAVGSGKLELIVAGYVMGGADLLLSMAFIVLVIMRRWSTNK